MALILRYQGQLTPLIAEQIAPGTSGWGDVGAASSGALGTGTDSIKSSTFNITTGATRTVPVIRFQDDLGRPAWEFTVQPPSTAAATITGPWSMRFYHRFSAMSAFVPTAKPIMRWDEGATTGRLTLNSDQASGGGTNHRPYFVGLPANPAVTGSNTDLYRYEIQVDPAATPKVVCRIYAQDEPTTIAKSMSISPTSVTWDTIVIGYDPANSYGTPFSMYADIEIHDDYNLGGQFTHSGPTGVAPNSVASLSAAGTPSTNPSIDASFNFNGTDASTPEAPLTLGVDYTIIANDVNYTTAGTFDRTVTIYQPTGDSAAGVGEKYPVVVWTHGGFGLEGIKENLPDNWRDDLLNNGYAVATVQYVLSSINGSAYGTSEAPGPRIRGGRYPSHIVDFKRAAAYIRDNSGTGETYSDLDPDLLIAAGFSFGGYIALAAALTPNVDFDGRPVPDGGPQALSLKQCTANLDAWGDGYIDPDPEFIGIYTYAAPVDLETASQYDPTQPDAGGLINQATRYYYNLPLSLGATPPDRPWTALATGTGGSESQDLIHVANTAGVVFPTTVHIRGSADYLVHYEHEPLIAAAFDDVGQAPKYFGESQAVSDPFHDGFLPFAAPPAIHPYANEIYQRNILITVMDTFVSTATAPPAAASDQLPSIPTIPSLPTLP